ncbi:hypothetical protein MMC31_007034 [Peltigera leucophlebia]|nr:hypothetical protein [Peltigera leucophlebia]
MLQSSHLSRTVYAGTFIHASSRNTLCVKERTIVGVDERGKIVAIASFEAEISGKDIEELGDEWIDHTVKIQWGWGERSDDHEEEMDSTGWKLVRAGKERWWFPGFVDTHIHAPQYQNAGIFGETTLLDWLEKYTYPIEASLADVTKASLVYSHCVAATLRHGTTTAAYFATIAVPSTNRLADVCMRAGQRAFIGRCNMDRPKLNPDYYRDESSASAIEDTRATIAHIAQIDPKHDLVTPIITPRFAPSCTPILLSELGKLSHETLLPIQTHISENPDEVALVASLFQDQGSYAEVYDVHGLLTSRTILAHAVHLTAEERSLISKRGSKVSHCPVSNSCLSSGLCPVKELLNSGIDVGLGTDVSGGWSPSILVAAREAATVSRILASVERDHPLSGSKSSAASTAKLTVEECLYLATVGGASCLGLSHKIGRFEIGMEWDAQLVSLGPSLNLEHPENKKIYSHDEEPSQILSNDVIREAESLPFVTMAQAAVSDQPVQLWGKESRAEKLAKWVFTGTEKNTLAVWVKGRIVHRRPEY